MTSARSAKFQVGEQVFVYLPADTWKRRPPFGTVEAATEYVDACCQPPRRYMVYSIRMEDGEQPNPIDVTEFFVDGYVEAGAEAGGHDVA